MKRIEYIDFMNIIACFSVVYLHCSGNVFAFGTVDSRLWFLSMFIQTVAHFAVPVFFMITGTTLLEYRKRYDTKTFLKKRFFKTGVPFLFWSYIYLLLPCVLDGADIPGVHTYLNAVLTNNANNIFWFFYYIFAIYMCIPAFSLIVGKEHFKIVEYICLLAFFSSAVYPVVNRFVAPVTDLILPPFLTGYVGYIFLGWLIYHEEYSRKIRMGIYACGISGAILMFWGTWVLSKQAGEIDTFFMEYNSIACYPMSAAVMLFGKHIPWDKVYKIIPMIWVKKIASAGLGIYVVHMILIILFERISVLNAHPAYFTVFMPVVIYGISLGIVLTLKKIPGVRRLIP